MLHLFSVEMCVVPFNVTRCVSNLFKQISACGSGPEM